MGAMILLDLGVEILISLCVEIEGGGGGMEMGRGHGYGGALVVELTGLETVVAVAGVVSVLIKLGDEMGFAVWVSGKGNGVGG
ncbi:B3 domain-containing protein [Pyrus ussuriensis x Pyrus communis]|uniref:B3 domain-containing protein n=1 Tax=Pyrus ussuriensis x Pyrus communis TaxID=2448454 RepID=A0A5N5HX85_9ROSA|nr:B3 domain-containing protein [Pyrus ussuriensis x Pyrus communis]